MGKKSYLFVIFISCLSCLKLVGQQYTSVPYFMGFESEEAEEWKNWRVNPGSQASLCHDQWTVGTHLYRDGQRAAYISSDSAHAFATFDSFPCVQYMYRDFLLPRGTYELSFDWLHAGNEFTTFGVGINQGANISLEANSQNGSHSQNVTFTPLDSNSANWQNYSNEFSVNGSQTVRIFFIWASKNTSDTRGNVSVCIDNVQIYNSHFKKPVDFSLSVNNTCSDVLCSWRGFHEQYELQYRKTTDITWNKVTNISSSVVMSNYKLFTTRVSNLEEGLYDFRVRGMSNDPLRNDTSAWLYSTNRLIFCPQDKCINYADIHNTSFVTCTYGNTAEGGFSGSYPTYSNDGYKAYKDTGVLDYGSTIRASQHTTNWDNSAKDPRTGGQLKLIPDNAFVSVRLGNWDINNGAESITYDYYIDSSNCLLLLKYAVVMEIPDHPQERQPRFTLEILRKDGSLADSTCGYFNFAAKEGGEWKRYHSDEPGITDVLWKDWTMMGLNLKDYIGETMKIRLTTYDCFESGHYCYAYFTIDCTSAILQTSACALEENPKLELAAPEGFNYKWFNDIGDSVSGTRNFFPPDTALYRCIVSSIENPDCSFELSAKCQPQIPNPRFSYRYEPESCKNIVNFENQSFISIYQNNGNVAETSKPCNSYQWETWNDAGWSQSSTMVNPSFEYPSEGGVFHVRLTAYLAQSSCQQTKDTTIVLPKIEPYNLSIDTFLCDGEGFYWEESNTTITTAGVYTRHLRTIAGCDSIITLNVTTRSPVFYKYAQTAVICANEVFCVNGDCYDKRKYDKRKKPNQFVRIFQATNGCDSTVIYDVIILDSIKPIIDVIDIDIKNARYSAEIHLSGTGYDYYTINDTLHDIQEDSVLTNLKPQSYLISFFKDSINSDTVVHTCRLDTQIDIIAECLDVSILPQKICEDGLPIITIPYIINKGAANSCDIKFSEEAKAQGFTDVENYPIDNVGGEIKLALPANITPGTYRLDFVFQDRICENLTIETSCIVAYPVSVLFTRWDEVISLKNQSTTGYYDFAFTDYQWFLNGQPIQGETKSYLWLHGGLDSTGEYQLQMTRTDGMSCITCPYVLSSRSPLYQNHRVTIEKSLFGDVLQNNLSNFTKISIYSSTGQLISRYFINDGNLAFHFPQNAGMYIVVLESETEKKVVPVLIK